MMEMTCKSNVVRSVIFTIILFWCSSISFCLADEGSPGTNAVINTHNIGDIHHQEFVPGRDTHFIVKMNIEPSPGSWFVYSQELAWGSPAGELTFDPETGEFHYLAPPINPHGATPDDWPPFAILFTGKVCRETIEGVSCETVSQTVTFNTSFTLKTYDIKEIPDQFFRPGYDTHFIVRTNQWGPGEDSGVTYGYEVSWGSTSGELSIDPATGTFHHLVSELQPGEAPASLRPFTLKFTASKNGESVSRTVTFTPGVDLPEEYSLIDTPCALINPDDSAYIVENVREVPRSGIDFNLITVESQPDKLREVSIAAKTLIIDAAHANSIYSKYNNVKDIKTMSLFAETIIIRDNWKLPQTNVNIHAKTLRFEDDGKITTTPINIEWRPAKAEYKFDANGNIWANGGSNFLPYWGQIEEGRGIPRNGLKGGSITLDIKELDTGWEKLDIPDNVVMNDNSTVRFNVSGAQGQPASEGLDGHKDGTNGSFIDGSYTDALGVHGNSSGTCNGLTYFGNEFGLSIPPHIGDKVVRLEYCQWPLFWSTARKITKGENIPTSGWNAIPATPPGAGGSGGSLTSTVTHDNTGNPINIVTYYRGGPSGDKGQITRGTKAGEPRNFVMLDYITPPQPNTSFPVIEEYRTVDGADGVPPEGYIGAIGKLVTSVSTRSWLHPHALQMVLAYARDLYIGGSPQEALAQIADYPEIINNYITSNPLSEYNDTLTQLNNEILLLIYQLELGLDYFGNPKGWTPMLSFEVSYTAYTREINHSLQVLYLNNWIRKAQTNLLVHVNAIHESKKLLLEDNVQLRQDFIDSQNEINQLHQKSGEISREVESLRDELLTFSEDLHGVHTTISGIDTAVSAGIKLVGAIPTVGKPLEGLLNAEYQVASIMPYPADQIALIFRDVSSVVSDADFTQKQAVIEEALQNATTYKQVLDRTSDMANGLQTISSMLSSTSVAPEDISSALNNLRQNYPYLQSTIDKTIRLMDKKKSYRYMLENALISVTQLPNKINENQLIINQLEHHLSESAGVVLSNADMLALANMERRAKERLTRYHDYLAKSYNYRMLTPYPATINLNSLLTNIISLVDANITTLKDVDLTAPETESKLRYKLESDSEDFINLKTLFEEELWTITDDIYKDYLEARGGAEQTASNSYQLTDTELETLKRKGAVTINLFEKGFFSNEKENVRLVDITVIGVTPTDNNLEVGSFGSVEVLMKHSGISRLLHNGETYLFQHHKEFNDNTFISWGATYDYMQKTLSPITPSTASDSLLRTLLDAHGKSENMLFYSRPAAWADITITASTNTENDTPIGIEDLTFLVEYDYTNKEGVNGTRLTVQLDKADIRPRFLVDTADINDRKDGRGEFIRLFDKNLNEVTIEAQPRYAPWSFYRWTNRQGNLPDYLIGNPYSAIITVPLDMDREIKACYILDTDEDGLDDTWEKQYFGGLRISNGTGDADGDGRSDLEEFRLGSVPASPDSEQDGMPDIWEAANQLDQTKNDAMGDPDEDMIPNIAEYYAGTDPNDRLDTPSTMPNIENFETGKLNKFNWVTSGAQNWEVSTNKSLAGAFSIRSPLLDSNQWAQFETSVLCDDGHIRFMYRLGANTCSNSLCDRLIFSIDGTEVGYLSGMSGENVATFPVSAGQHTFAWKFIKGPNTTTGDEREYIDEIWFPANLSSWDTDQDGMPDSYEINYNLNPLLNDWHDDYDNDGFTNGEEFELGMNPCDPAGDLNRDGDITLTDAILGLRMLTGMAPSSQIKMTGADVNSDGIINIAELIHIIKNISTTQ